MRRALLVVLAAALGPVAPAVAAGPATADCPTQPGFRCGTLRVPLDRSGGVPGTLGLRIAVQPGRKPVLVALSGGPGQGSVRYATSFAESLRPALGRYRLAVLDQRGTGGSGALRCPGLQGLSELSTYTPEAIAGCADQIGPQRAFYGTADTVADLDALRAALGVRRIALMGVSYGTFVAVQYARTHPDRTDRLILDSSVGPDGVDTFLLDTFSRLPRILREQCAEERCAGATDDPVADVGAVLTRLAGGPLRAPVRSATGRARVQTVANADEFTSLLLSGDLNPALQALLPGAVRAARDGDAAPLVRLRRLAAGPPTATSDLSAGLNVATGCADAALPYGLGEPLAAREAATDAALGAIAPARYAPFPALVVRHISYAEDCLRWPGTPAPTPPSRAPLPDVPVLLLNGRADMRTPLENAQALAAAFPHASLVAVPGTGHDELDSDATGCAARALDRFVGERRVGDPCREQTNAQDVDPRPPLRLGALRPPDGTRGDRGRVVAAAMGTLLDARDMALATLYAGFRRMDGGGLRAGAYRARFDGRGLRIALRGAAWVPGVRVRGEVLASNGSVVGTLHVNGPGALDGRLVLAGDGSLAGVIGGRRVIAGFGSARAAGIHAGAPDPVARALRWVRRGG